MSREDETKLTDKERDEILDRNIKKEITLSAHYSDLSGELIKIGENWIELRLDKKSVANIKKSSIHLIIEKREKKND